MEMTVAAPDAKHPMALRRLEGEAAEAARGEAADEAEICGDATIAEAIQTAPLVLEWEVFREEMDEDAWFALHLWQAWILERQEVGCTRLVTASSTLRSSGGADALSERE
jgi:hypothetical protein